MEKNINNEYARRIIAVGESLIKNAESIAGSEKYISNISIHIEMLSSPDGITPEINISKNFYPEQTIDSQANNKLKS